MKQRFDKLAFYFLVVLLVFTTTAAVTIWQREYTPTVVWRSSGHELVKTAMEAARADIVNGQPKVCLAGTFGKWPIGVVPELRPLTAGMPEQVLPNGWSNAFAARAIIYASAYNAVVLEHLKSQGGSPES